MKAQMKLAYVMGALCLLVSGLPLACDGLNSTGDIKGQAVDPTWTAVSNTNTTFGTSYNTIHTIAYGNSRFVAVGQSGKGAYSSDGINWTAIGNMGFYNGDYDRDNDTIYGIAYGGGKFVAVGAYTPPITGKAAYSTNGVSWTAVSNTTFGTDTIRAIAYGNGKFVAVGGIGKAAWSTDGVTWTAVSIYSTGTTNNLTAITYGDGKFVAVNDDCYSFYSSDGINWTGADVLFESRNALYGVAYGNGKFVAVGQNGKAFCNSFKKIPAQLMFNPDGSVTWKKAQ
jgi:hypothetical protein